MSRCACAGRLPADTHDHSPGGCTPRWADVRAVLNAQAAYYLARAHADDPRPSRLRTTWARLRAWTAMPEPDGVDYVAAARVYRARGGRWARVAPPGRHRLAVRAALRTAARR